MLARSRELAQQYLKEDFTHIFLEKKRMATPRAFAVAELVLGILIVLVSLLWCYVIPNLSFTSNWSISYEYWTIVALGVIVAIVAVAALAKK
jgi:hypothetical protein